MNANDDTVSNVAPRIIPRSQHCVSRKNIDQSALKVLYRLHRCGFQAYLVGGSVRDLMVGRKPKDFDVATNARPNKIKKLFRNAFLIGKRFRLAHIKFGSTIIEVSTFRREPDHSPEGGTSGKKIRRENTYGTPAEDAFRRDYTVNALFYNIADFTIIDYPGGVHDLHTGIIRAIGEPDKRYLEDPVRMLRAIRAATRLSFSIEGGTLQAIAKNQQLIAKAPPSRLLEEIQVLIKMGTAHRTFKLLETSGLINSLFPEIYALYASGIGPKRELFYRYLTYLDQLYYLKQEQSPVVYWGTIFLACLHLCYPSEKAFLMDKKMCETAYQQISNLMQNVANHYTLPRKQRVPIKNILQTFPLLFKARIKKKTFRGIREKSYLKELLALLWVYSQTTATPALFTRWKRTFQR